MNGVGAHEVIVETPEHTRALLATSRRRTSPACSSAYRDRMHRPVARQRLKYVMIFKNHGTAAGATLDHPHSQLIALPVVPRVVVRGDEGRAQALARQGALRLLRHRAPGAARSARAWSTRTTASWSSSPMRPSFPSKPGFCRARTVHASSSSSNEDFALSGQCAQGRAAQAECGARRPAVQLHPAHHAIRRRRSAVLPLAHRNHADA